MASRSQILSRFRSLPVVRRVASAAAFASLGALSSVAHAAPLEMVVQTLKADGQMLHTLVRDLDGDGRNELLVVARSGRPTRPERVLHVWKAGPSGFQPQPTLSLAIPARTVAIDVCDVDAAPGSEVLFLHATGIEILGQTGPLAFETKPRSFLSQSSSLAFADPNDAPFIELCRFPKGGKPELWVPTWSGVQVLTLEGGKAIAGPVLSVGPRAEHVVRDEFRGPRERRDYALLTTLAYPTLTSMDADNDGDEDVYATLEDRVWLFLRHEGQLSPTPAARRFLGMRTDDEFREDQNRLKVYFGDVTGDKLPDAVAVKNTGRFSNLQSELRVYAGRGAQGFDNTPLATRKHNGYAVPEGVMDLDGDGVAEILEPYLDTGPASIAQLVITLTIDMEFHALRLKGNQFVEGEAMELEFGFEFGGNGVMGTLPLFGRDVDGDKITDRVDLGFGDKALIFLGKRGDPAYQEDEAYKVSVPVTQKASWYETRAGAPASVVIFRPKDKDLGGALTVLWNKKGN